MRKKRKTAGETIAIIGGGPAGAALGALLAQAGRRVLLFAAAERPELIVGESLIPSVIPVLREIGVEDRVREIGTFKPGATFYVRPGDSSSVLFADSKSPLPHYAYNVPRKEFDQILLDAAREAGVQVVEATAGVSRSNSVDRVQLDSESLAAAGKGLSEQPDFIVDASGRSRLLSRLLALPAVRGQRNDEVRFAHFEGCELEHDGHVHVNRLSAGWSWRIPLPGKVSLGVVIERGAWARAGETAGEQFDEFLAGDKTLATITSGARRVTPVLRYSNYQLMSKRLVGGNWALVGDAAGFVDPIFSSGVELSLTGATALAGALLSPEPDALARYERQAAFRLHAWKDLIESFYAGRLFALRRIGALAGNRFPWKMFVPWVEAAVNDAITGMVSQQTLRCNVARFALRSKIGGSYAERVRVR